MLTILSSLFGIYLEQSGSWNMYELKIDSTCVDFFLINEQKSPNFS